MARTVPQAACDLAAKFWPGPLTLVLPKRDHVPDLATSGLPKVALRVPLHSVAMRLLKAFGGPLAAPSANRFGRISPTDAAAVYTELGDTVPLVLDGGRVLLGWSRLSWKSRQRKSGCCGRVEFRSRNRKGDRPGATRNVAQGNQPLAPGQLEHHYAPRKPLRLLSPGEEPPSSSDTGWLAFGVHEIGRLRVVENLSFRGDLREAASNFFRALRTLDDDPRVKTIYANRVPDQGLGLAINERLQRASTR